jgi:hypothetical protein
LFLLAWTTVSGGGLFYSRPQVCPAAGAVDPVAFPLISSETRPQCGSDPPTPCQHDDEAVVLELAGNREFALPEDRDAIATASASVSWRPPFT